MSAEKYLGMIVGYRCALEQHAAADELQKKERAKQLANAFDKTDIENIWLAASDIRIPHFDAKKRMAGIDLALGDCGKIKRRRGLAIGLKIKDELYGGPYWNCARKGDKIVYEMQQPAPMWDDKRFNFSGTTTPNGVSYTAADMRDSFLQFMVIIVPTTALAGIAPVDLHTADAAKTKRKIIAQTA